MTMTVEDEIVEGQIAKVCERCGDAFTLDVAAGRFAHRLAGAVRFCPGCQTRQSEAWAAQDAERDRQEAEQEWARRLRSSGLPDRFWQPTVDSETDPEALGLARRWANGDVDGLALLGTVGVGKTHLAGMAFATRLRKRSGYWRTVPSLLADLSAGFGTRPHQEALGVLTGRRMLALDDLDKGRGSEFVAQHVFAAIDNAYTHRLPLLVTSNCDLDQLAGRWGDHGPAIASRIAGYCKAIWVGGADRRTEGSAA